MASIPEYRTRDPQTQTLVLHSAYSQAHFSLLCGSSLNSLHTLQVNDTQPLWFFSAANSDCKSGMVLAVNPPTSGETAAAFMQNAEASTGTTSSSQAQSSPSTSGSSSVSQSGSGTASSAVSPSASSSPQKDGAMSHLAQLESIFVGVVAAIGLSFTL